MKHLILNGQLKCSECGCPVTTFVGACMMITPDDLGLDEAYKYLKENHDCEVYRAQLAEEQKKKLKDILSGIQSYNQQN